MKRGPHISEKEPIAMVLHKSSSLFRYILDLSFQLKINGKKVNSVNGGTNNKAPQKSMAQLVVIIRRMLANMKQHYNIHKPFYFSKCDIKDGFGRMVVSHENEWNF